MGSEEDRNAFLTQVRKSCAIGRKLRDIGIRSYGKAPAQVARYGVARIRGMAKGGVSACPKHFPGKGHSPLDAHLRLSFTPGVSVYSFTFG